MIKNGKSLFNLDMEGKELSLVFDGRNSSQLDKLSSSRLAQEFARNLFLETELNKLLNAIGNKFNININEACGTRDGECFVAVMNCIFGVLGVVSGFASLLACPLTGPFAVPCVILAVAGVTGGGYGIATGCGELGACGGETDVEITATGIYITTVKISDDEEYNVDCNDPFVDCIDEIGSPLDSHPKGIVP
ncbi:MAG: hypothetical protein ACK5NT_05660 [Pyrinomonadaceae bacterium]